MIRTVELGILKNLCKQHNLDEKLIDENKSYFENKKLLLSQTSAKVQSEVKKTINENLELAKKRQEELKIQEQKTKQELEETIEKIKSESVDINQFYGNLPKLLDMTNKEMIKTLFIVGKAGTGKTTMVLNNFDFDVSIGGHMTARKLYELLYDNKDGKIYLNDMEDMLTDKKIIALLKQSCDTREDREVAWESTKDSRYPQRFRWNGTMILDVNKFPSGFDAIISRGNTYEVNFTYNQILQIMYAIAKKPKEINGTTLTDKERMEIVDFIKKYSDETCEDFSLRTQYKIEIFYAYDKNLWKELAMDLLNKKNDVLVIVKQLVETGRDIEWQVREFKKLTNLGRRSYFNYKKAVKG